MFYCTAIFNKEEDIGTYTIRAVDDLRTLNKILYIKPPGNIYSFNELVSLWEKKIGKTLERGYILEDQLVKNIQGLWASFVKECSKEFFSLKFLADYIFSRSEIYCTLFAFKLHLIRKLMKIAFAETPGSIGHLIVNPPLCFRQRRSNELCGRAFLWCRSFWA